MFSNLNPFDQIIFLENERINLYKDLLIKNEEEDIAKKWTEYAANTLNGLLLIADLAKTVYLRYNDEYTKDKERIHQDDEMKIKLVNKISNVLKIQLESSILLRIYSEISSIGLFREKNSVSFPKPSITSENHIDFIFSLFFKPNLLEGSLDKIAPLMTAISETNQKQRLLGILADTKVQEPELNDILSSVNETYGRYYGEYLADFIKKVSQTWWWKDDIGAYFILDQGLNNFNRSVELSSNSKDREIKSKTERLKLISVPLSKAASIYSISSHNYGIAIDTASKGLHNHAAKYFEKVHDLCDEALKLIGEFQIGEEMRALHKNLNKTKKKSKFLQNISLLNVAYRNMINDISSKNIEDALKKVNEIKQICKTINGKIEIKYLSAIPSIFKSIATTTELMISLHHSEQEIIDQTIHVIDSFKTRIITATNQIVSNWTELSDTENRKELRNELSYLKEDINLLIESSSFLPGTIKDRDQILIRLEILKNFSLSISHEIKASNTNEENIILELLHKSKANFFASKAFELSKLVPKEQLPFKRILAHFSGSFISARTVQMQIYQLTTQFICLSEVIPSLFLSVTQDPNLINNKFEAHESIQTSLKSHESFKNMLYQIKNDCQILLEHKQEYGKIIANVHWDQLKIRQSLVLGIIKFFDSICDAIAGSWATKLGLFDDAVLNFKTAQDIAFEAAEILKDVSAGEQKKENVSTHVYSFAQFCQNSHNQMIEEKIIQLPAQKLFKLLRDMVFSI